MLFTTGHTPRPAYYELVMLAALSVARVSQASPSNCVVKDISPSKDRDGRDKPVELCFF